MFAATKADLARLSASGKTSTRTLVSGLLSQGFQAILVYRVFHWLYGKGISGQPLLQNPNQRVRPAKNLA